ncbi:DUF1285 domain-containing protein [Idiomarina seosinensis]|uniref:DUF1285 domain-containing protein n=1 Tax=Idiomarina seosinensis TaxID=281739 RepID=UPI00384C170A
MSLERLFQQLESHQRAPTEQWDPPYCGELPIRIMANGDWHYQGSKINRPALVKLFASVLKREGDDYYLVTPAEKVKIQVEDAPFVIVDWQVMDIENQQAIQVVSNIDERYILSAQTPLVLSDGIPYVQLGKGLTAKVHRNVFYQWAEMATPVSGSEHHEFVIYSAGHAFSLGHG